MKTNNLIWGAALCAAFLAFSPNANAVSYTFTSADAQADFTLGNGSLTLKLTSLEQNPGSAGGLLSGIWFDISGLSGSGVLSSTSQSGLTSTIQASGAYTTGVLESPLARWDATHTGASVLLTALGGGQPDHLIIGPDSLGNFNPNLGGTYTPNSSVFNFLPVVLGSATFVYSLNGVTANSLISNVIFNFGTQLGEGTETGTTITNKASVPDAGSTVLLLGAVLSGLGMMVRRIK